MNPSPEEDAVRRAHERLIDAGWEMDAKRRNYVKRTRTGCTWIPVARVVDMTLRGTAALLLCLSMGCAARRGTVRQEYARGKYDAENMFRRLNTYGAERFLRTLSPSEGYMIGVAKKLLEYARGAEDVDPDQLKIRSDSVPACSDGEGELGEINGKPRECWY